MASSKRVYSWEVTQPDPDQEWGGSRRWDGGIPTCLREVSDDEKTGGSHKPGEELLSYLLEENRCGRMTAKQCCVISFWASQAGVEDVSCIALPPWNQGSGDFARLIAKVNRKNPTGPDLYMVKCPSYQRRALRKMMWDLPVVLPHEALANELEGADLGGLMASWTAPPNYDAHPVVQEARGAEPPALVIPISVFVDGVAYAKRDTLLVFSMANLLTEKRTILCVLRKRVLCKCACKGWESLHAVFSWLRWCLLVLKEGTWPLRQHNGDAWSPENDQERDRRAGTPLGFRAAAIQLRGDWSEFSNTFQVPQWNSSNQPCFLCEATADDLFTQLPECGFRTLPWAPKTEAAFELACQSCEIEVPALGDDEWRTFNDLLFPDQNNAKGLALLADCPALDLKRGDRVEPTSEMLDVDDILTNNPGKFLMWRHGNETLTRRRVPLFTAELGTDLPNFVCRTRRDAHTVPRCASTICAGWHVGTLG